MKLLSSLAALLIAAITTSPALAAKNTVRLVAERNLQPTTTFELRFDEAMIPPDQIGQTAATSPVVFRPAVKGSFVWLSQRSGTFKPEEPLTLSTTYSIALASGLKKADGQPLDADFRETIQTPPMQLKGWNTQNWRGEADALAEPKLALLFNVNLEPEVAGRFCKYLNARGDEVPARVERADPARHSEQYFPVWRSSDRSLRTWADRFYEDRKPATGLEARPAVTSAGNHLWVTPVQPLPAGEGWRLVIAAGLPASDAGLRLLDPVEIKIGTVRPFDVMSAEASNYIDSGRRLSLWFSKNLAKEVTAKNLTRWVRVEPEPRNFKSDLSQRGVVFTGDFELAREYRVIVEAGLPSEEPFLLAQSFSKTVRFSQVPPRLYFEEFATHQLSTGTREFHFLAVNVPKVKVSARVFSPEAAPLALGAWRAYENPPRKENDRNYEEPYGKVDLAQMPGQTVWQQELAATGAVDEKEEISLDWNEILGANKTGVVLLTAEQAGEPAKPGERPGAQVIVQVTDIGVVWKQSKDETFVHVFSLAGGKAVAGAKLRLLDVDNNILDEATADAAGLVRMKTDEKAKWILAQNGADMHLVDFKDRAESLSLRRLGIREVNSDDEEDADDSRQALLFTERPVYKPGETAHLKGILRDWRAGQSHIPAGAKAKLLVTDPQERNILNHAITISDAGSFSEDIKLPTSGLGTYSVALIMEEDGPDAGALATHNFEVQEYTPNSFEIKIAQAPRAVGETKIELPITAQYYMGKALSQAQLTWSLTASDDGFAPAGFAAFDFCNAIRDYELNEKLDRNSHFSEQGKADLDAQGAAKVATIIPLNAKAPQPRSAELLCEITDLDQQTVSQSADFTIHSSDFYLGIRRPRGVIRQGETLPVDVIAVRTDGTPTPEPVATTVRLTRVDWQNNRVETAGGATEYRHQARFELVSQAAVQTRPLTKTEGKWTLTSAGQSAPLVAGKPGQYLLEAVSKDVGGRDAVTTTSFSVYGEGETEWDYENQYQIELVADKEEYRSGQTAKVLIKTPIAGEALVTIERDKVLRSFVTQLSGNAPVVEVPLEDADAPNVFVSVMLLRGAADSPRKFKAPEYRVGYCKLKVARVDAKLTVYVEPSAPSYRPGDEVRVGAQVLDFAGKPVANAEVTLYAVDEGVLSLMGYETPDPLTFFNQERALAVTTGLTLPTLLSEDPEERSFANKGYLVGGGGEEGSEAMRKNFVACALWNGSLRTDAEGRIAATFIAPDSLTRYRVMAVVQTARDQFGRAESAFEVNKPVMLEPSLPRFANVGDKIVLRGVLHNLTENDGEVDVKLELDATASGADTTRHVKLPAHGSLAVDFPVEFKEVGQAVWKWSASFAGGGVSYRDAVQTTLNVGYPVPLQRELRSSQTRSADSDLLAGMNPALLEGAGVVRVSITNSRIIELRESLEQLLHYPYGCVEQTTSSTLPWISMRDFQGALPSLKKTDEQIAAAVNHGVDRLFSMQTSSGGLSYWPGGQQPMFWGSAYGGLGLAMARRAGFEVPEQAFDRLCKYLSEQLRGSGGDQFDPYSHGSSASDRCLALYTLALAGRAEPAYHELLFKKRDQLSPENRALLALAIVASDGPKEMVEQLLNAKQEAKVPENDWFWSPSRDTAMRLLAWSRHQPESPVVGKLVAELMGRRLGGHWSTTQGNCWSLLALGEYFRHVEKTDAEIAGTLTWQRQQEHFAVNHETPLRVLDFPLGKDAAAKPLKLANPEKRQLFTEVLIEARPRGIQQPRQDQGYAIRRSYAKIEDDGTLSELTEPRVGDRVLITLNVEVRKPAHYLAVDDPLPAIFEAVNPVFKSQATRAGEVLGRDWLSDHQELREDRALFFADEIYPGQYTIRYLARVRAAGTATAPAAKVEEMYHPERFGMTETLQLTSLPLK
jgi:uncharacterized protein YfaS (alpha-2-macroglobulin family)